MVKYIYDAWGNHKVVDNAGVEITDVNHIGNINPYRYRGYYFDTETGLYYLKSRYYDPQTGRFISIDDISFADPDTINGLNLYAYCCNNHVMHIDPTGQYAINSLYDGKMRWFGWEGRFSNGWETDKLAINNFFTRVGLSHYVTQKTGNKAAFYAFYGVTKDSMSYIGETGFAGVGLNVYDKFGVEFQLETLGFGGQISIGRKSISLNINLLGPSSLSLTNTVENGNGLFTTTGFTIGINTGLIVIVLGAIYGLLTGNFMAFATN